MRTVTIGFGSSDWMFDSRAKLLVERYWCYFEDHRPMIQVDITATNDIFNDRFPPSLYMYPAKIEVCICYIYTFYYCIEVVLSFSDGKEGAKCQCIQTSV
jgi:hypothetical protein